MNVNFYDSDIVVNSLSDGTKRCALCRRAVNSEEVYYSEFRDVLCLPCKSMEKKAAEQRLANAVRLTAYLSFVFALISVFFNPFFVFTVPTLSSGIGPLGVLMRHIGVRERLKPQLGAILFCASSGIMVGLLVVIVTLLGWENPFV